MFQNSVEDMLQTNSSLEKIEDRFFSGWCVSGMYFGSCQTWGGGGVSAVILMIHNVLCPVYKLRYALDFPLSK